MKITRKIISQKAWANILLFNNIVLPEKTPQDTLEKPNYGFSANVPTPEYQSSFPKTQNAPMPIKNPSMASQAPSQKDSRLSGHDPFLDAMAPSPEQNPVIGSQPIHPDQTWPTQWNENPAENEKTSPSLDQKSEPLSKVYSEPVQNPQVAPQMGPSKLLFEQDFNGKPETQVPETQVDDTIKESTSSLPLPPAQILVSDTKTIDDLVSPETTQSTLSDDQTDIMLNTLEKHKDLLKEYSQFNQDNKMESETSDLKNSKESKSSQQEEASADQQFSSVLSTVENTLKKIPDLTDLPEDKKNDAHLKSLEQIRTMLDQLIQLEKDKSSLPSKDHV